MPRHSSASITAFRITRFFVDDDADAVGVADGEFVGAQGAGLKGAVLGNESADDVLAEDLFDVFNLQADSRVRAGGGIGVGHDVQFDHAAADADIFWGFTVAKRGDKSQLLFVKKHGPGDIRGR